MRVLIIILSLLFLVAIWAGFGIQWVFICIMAFFGFGIGKAIKIYYINRNISEYMAYLKFPAIGLSVTFFISGILHKYWGMDAPTDNWVTWIILAGPFVIALLGDEAILEIDGIPGPGPQSRDVPFYANRLAKQMQEIAKLGARLERYFPSAYQACPNRMFIEESLTTFKSVGGQSGDAALEIYRDLDKDIETMKLFLGKWKGIDSVDTKLLSFADKLHRELLTLKSLIDDTPPDMMAGCIEIVRRKR